MSKIHFESNSQQSFGFPNEVYWKRYDKDTFWKQFTTEYAMCLDCSKLETICQRYILKAIHNMIWYAKIVWLLETICQRYILKAIHNEPVSAWVTFKLETIGQIYILKAIHNNRVNLHWYCLIGNDSTKIHFESNSQPINRAKKVRPNWKR